MKKISLGLLLLAAALFACGYIFRTGLETRIAEFDQLVEKNSHKNIAPTVYLDEEGKVFKEEAYSPRNAAEVTLGVTREHLAMKYGGNSIFYAIAIFCGALGLAFFFIGRKEKPAPDEGKLAGY